jgi:hypothetical protein
MKAASIAWLVLLLSVAAPRTVGAQEDDEEVEESESSDDEGGDEDSEDRDEGEAEDDEGEDDGEDAAADAPRSWFFGPFLRYAILPSFMLKISLAEAPTVDNAAFGIAANHRDPEGMSFEIGLGYTGLGFHGPMRADGDIAQDTEWVDSNLAMVHLTGSVYWTAPILDELSFEYGLGIDLGLLLGDVVRTEAYRPNGSWRRCPGVIPVPNLGSDYCEPPQGALVTNTYDEDGAHYGVVEERVPGIFGSLMLPHLALRYQPMTELAVKLEGALGFPMFFLGLSAAYAPEL